MDNHSRFYAFSEIYDIAFDFKDIPSECAFLKSVCAKFSGKEAASFLDLAAGPALHAIEMSRQGLHAGALDLSPEMVAYAKEKSRRLGTSIDCREGEMSSFTWDRRFDMAGLFMDSASYLLTNEAVISHLRSVAAVLETGGIYVVEMSHPRDVFSIANSTANHWGVERDGVKVSVQWGDEFDTFDPIRQLTETTVRLRFRQGPTEKELVERAPQRCFTTNEFNALVRAEGSFVVKAVYGAMDESVPFTNEKSAWRMVTVLGKV